jgi:predicted molibdopterin-dependent oxidoreductase YjgC
LLGGVDTGFLAEGNNTLGAIEMGVVPDLYPGRRPCRDAHSRVRSRLTSVWGGRLSPVKGLDFDGMMAAAEDGALKGLWIMGADPAAKAGGAGETLAHIPFLIVQDQFVTETASLADVVLPAAAYAETSGSYLNATGRFQAFGPAKRPPGKARADWWIITQLARRMVETKRQRAWEFDSGRSVLQEIIKVVPAYRGLDVDLLYGEGWQPRAPESQTRRSFRRVEVAAAGADPDYPLRLVTGKLLYDRGTFLSHCAPIQKLVSDAYAMVHPNDARGLGLTEGESVSIVSAQGHVELAVRLGADVAPGVVWAPANLSDVALSSLGDERRQPLRVRIEKSIETEGD